MSVGQQIEAAVATPISRSLRIRAVSDPLVRSARPEWFEEPCDLRRGASAQSPKCFVVSRFASGAVLFVIRQHSTREPRSTRLSVPNGDHHFFRRVCCRCSATDARLIWLSVTGRSGRCVRVQRALHPDQHYRSASRSSWLPTFQPNKRAVNTTTSIGDLTYNLLTCCIVKTFSFKHTVQ